jgi:hypothetical protein
MIILRVVNQCNALALHHSWADEISLHDISDCHSIGRFLSLSIGRCHTIVESDHLIQFLPPFGCSVSQSISRDDRAEQAPGDSDATTTAFQTKNHMFAYFERRTRTKHHAAKMKGL